MKNEKQAIKALQLISSQGGDCVIVTTRAEWGHTHSYMVSEITLSDDNETEEVFISRRSRIPNSLPSSGVDFESAADIAGLDLVSEIEKLCEGNGIELSVFNTLEIN